MISSKIVLEADDLHKSFGAIIAADAVSVQVPERAIWSLIGANGAGKTTFINIVTGYIKPDRGRILFSGRDVTDLDPRELTRAGICRSFQIPQLYANLTVLENLLVAMIISDDKPPSMWRSARSSTEIERALEVLEQFGIAEQCERLPNELSAGVRKLLDIALALARSPKLVLLDEPTSGVAAEEKFELMDKVIEALATNEVSILFVEHDMDIVSRYSERVLAFYEGRIIANDVPESALADPDVRRYVTGSGGS